MMPIPAVSALLLLLLKLNSFAVVVEAWITPPEPKCENYTHYNGYEEVLCADWYEWGPTLEYPLENGTRVTSRFSYGRSYEYNSTKYEGLSVVAALRWRVEETYVNYELVNSKDLGSSCTLTVGSTPCHSCRHSGNKTYDSYGYHISGDCRNVPNGRVFRSEPLEPFFFPLEPKMDEE